MQKWKPSGTVSTYRITLSDADPIIVTNSVGDVIAWERQKKAAWHESFSMEAALWVAFRAAKREGLTAEPTFDQFIPRVVNLEVQEVVDEDPTPPDQSES